MEHGRGTGDSNHPLPLIGRLRMMDYHGPPLPQRQCPRCHSNDTKFCYFNNYSVEQPRYYCRACERHWTHGGIQRNIPSGGKSRKEKKSTIKRESQRAHHRHLNSNHQMWLHWLSSLWWFLQ